MIVGWIKVLHIWTDFSYESVPQIADCWVMKGYYAHKSDRSHSLMMVDCCVDAFW